MGRYPAAGVGPPSLVDLGLQLVLLGLPHRPAVSWAALCTLLFPFGHLSQVLLARWGVLSRLLLCLRW